MRQKAVDVAIAVAEYRTGAYDTSGGLTAASNRNAASTFTYDAANQLLTAPPVAPRFFRILPVSFS